jgi:hypothetical protein
MTLESEELPTIGICTESAKDAFCARRLSSPAVDALFVKSRNGLQRDAFCEVYGICIRRGVFLVPQHCEQAHPCEMDTHNE